MTTSTPKAGDLRIVRDGNDEYVVQEYQQSFSLRGKRLYGWISISSRFWELKHAQEFKSKYLARDKYRQGRQIIKEVYE